MNLKVAFQEHPALEYTVGLAKSLVKLGVKLRLFGASQPDPHGLRIYSKGFSAEAEMFRTTPRSKFLLYHKEDFPHDLKRLAFPLLLYSVNRPLLFTALALGGYDVFHLNLASNARVALRAKRLSKANIVYTNHMSPIPEPIPLENYKDPLASFYEEEKRWISILGEIAFRIVVPSNYAKKVLKEVFDLPSVVIPHGVDLENFNPMISGQRVKKQIRIEENTKLILWVSRFGQHSYKDPFTFIKAIPQVKKRYSRVKFLMVGQGPLYPYAMEMARKLDVMDALQTMAYVNNLNEYFAATDVFVLTSYNDTFGLTLLEAMACGRPVIASNSGGPQEVVGDAGLLFEYGNPGDLADKITQLLSDKELAVKLGKKAHERASNCHTWEEAATKYLEVYRCAAE